MPRLLDLASCQGGATKGYQRAGFHVTAIDNDRLAIKRNPADVTLIMDALVFLEKRGKAYDAIHASFPCQRWAANGANPSGDEWPDYITPARELLNATGKPWVMENVKHAPLRRDLILCGTMFDLTTTDTDGVKLYLQRHRIFESNIPLSPPKPCHHPKGVQWAGVYGGARHDKDEARYERAGGYVPPSADVQSALLGGVDWMTGRGRQECIPPVYAEHVGGLLMNWIKS